MDDEGNMEELRNYAALVTRGRPDFIEVKGVTFCGATATSDITMKNVPYHQEVIKFCEDLVQQPELADYALACEHEHSCCILIAHKKFFINDTWHTWIDYDKFHELVRSGKPFTSMDYVAPTASWATYNAPEHGFDPRETRWRRKTKEPLTGGC
eukprot:NODE_7880_length_573_cov_33.878924_g7857_i0.p1 GENE.NODE_7880_length_573_cov_33.878924_g7857_i0~~NODE_7880_length_573_cov_33.878924_g7857_i0.p1  ORF type:complete len:166 (+),score=46.72 NODE_7880_length_573_cov_33.878924_g7857_i0:37-498(+)